jgi:DNA-binding NarL/FixJ family response regulator
VISVILVDDQPLLRQGFRMVLEEEDGIVVVGEASDGAAGLEVARRCHPDVVVMDVRSVADGDAVVAPSVTRRLLDVFAQHIPDPQRASPAAHPELDQLTAREREILAELAGGFSNAEIADRLFVAEATVKTHLGRVLTKLGLRDRVQAVVLAYETGLASRLTPDVGA